MLGPDAAELSRTNPIHLSPIHLSHALLHAEEKVDGGNIGISFDKNDSIMLQKRGHWVTPASETQYSKLDGWLKMRREVLHNMLGTILDVRRLNSKCLLTHELSYADLYRAGFYHATVHCKL